MKLQLESSVSSLQDLKALILDIRNYARWFAHNSIKERMHAKRMSEQPVISLAAHTQITAWAGKTPLTPKRLDALLEALEDFEATAPQITITLAAPASGNQKQTLVAWCREHIAPNVLVNFQFNSTLLGGMTIRSGSHIFDWSFRRQILDARAKFPEVLRRV